MKTRKSTKINYNKRKTKKKKSVSFRYTNQQYSSGDGMLTNIWGPGLWHYLHTMSFNYPVNPSLKDKHYYYTFMKNLGYVLPCVYCRNNYKINIKNIPLTKNVFSCRDSFSRYVYNLHEHVNEMLGKKSNLTYEMVRDRYEHFRSRCGTKNPVKATRKTYNNTKKYKESGCVDPLHGKKSKCVLKIVPITTQCETLKIDKSIIPV